MTTTSISYHGRPYAAAVAGHGRRHRGRRPRALVVGIHPAAGFRPADPGPGTDLRCVPARWSYPGFHHQPTTAGGRVLLGE